MSSRSFINDLEREARALEMYEYYTADHSIEEVGAAWGISKQRVHQIFIEFGFERRPRQWRRPRIFNRPDVLAIYPRYIAGEKTAILAAEIGVSISTFRNLIKRCGLQLRLQHWTKEQVEDMYRLKRDQGFTQAEIGERYGLGQSRVSALFVRYGYNSK